MKRHTRRVLSSGVTTRLGVGARGRALTFDVAGRGLPHGQTTTKPRPSAPTSVTLRAIAVALAGAAPRAPMSTAIVHPAGTGPLEAGGAVRVSRSRMGEMPWKPPVTAGGAAPPPDPTQVAAAAGGAGIPARRPLKRIATARVAKVLRRIGATLQPGDPAHRVTVAMQQPRRGLRYPVLRRLTRAVANGARISIMSLTRAGGCELSESCCSKAAKSIVCCGTPCDGQHVEDLLGHDAVAR